MCPFYPLHLSILWRGRVCGCFRYAGLETRVGERYTVVDKDLDGWDAKGLRQARNWKVGCTLRWTGLLFALVRSGGGICLNHDYVDARV
jgi:hypothetical protein